MISILKEKKILDFYKENQKEIENLQRQLINLFNKCGLKYKENDIQLGFITIFFLQFLKSTNAPNEEIKKALKNLENKI